MALEAYRSRTQISHERPVQDNLLTVEISGTSFRFKNPDGSPASAWVDSKGDPGAAGADGTNSGITVTSETAGGPISAGDLVGKRSDGKVYRLDKDDAVYIHTPLGIATNAAVLNDAVTVQIEGEYTDAAYSFTAHAPVFLGTAGAVTTTAPTTGYVLRVGYASATGTLVIDIYQPIKLA